mmetsp:Transcript_51803/g.46500  ORF Transcript_51803/g.46500 Transcript_51803/m.46500 type:complete len:114 (+) Transcript_51803:122-463(+)|eukprot:CAMPEP_0201565462 /NCGR_PEP_ID=MMETSP0190_2-20130828/4576_1 /ASSEMBLY_ACC=CAM_ASM_000263 /TAXON_ID=37353 /ORGANISM="Rosalina sp." /LENGTH=113 /DNA_ID=CAMNT_0047982975 /DNA_START=107 /DNA_END=448 /DNA_ORIENTATION=+
MANSEYNDELDDSNYYAHDSAEEEDCTYPMLEDPYFIASMIAATIIMSLLCIWLGCYCHKKRKNNNKIEEEVLEFNKVNDIEKDEDEEMEPDEDDSLEKEDSNTNETEPSNTI